MRKGLTLGFFLLAALLGAAGIASAVTSSLLTEGVEATLSVRVSPEKLPTNEYVPIAVTISGKVSTSDGTHPSALREMGLDIDKDVKLRVKGLPACGGAGRDQADAKALIKACRPALLGEGKAHVEVAPPDGPPEIVSGRLLVFNGGERGGEAKLLIFASAAGPSPAWLIARVAITRSGGGLRTTSAIPTIADGSGSLIDFRFHIGRTYAYKGKTVGYLEAKCPDDTFEVSAPRLIFKNEAMVPNVPSSTVLKGRITAPCTPQS